MIEETKAAASNFRFAVATSGAIAAWLLGRSNGGSIHGSLAWLEVALIGTMPLLVSGLLFVQVIGMGGRNFWKRTYLLKLESRMCLPGFGWEVEKRSISPIHQTVFYRMVVRLLDGPIKKLVGEVVTADLRAGFGEPVSGSWVPGIGRAGTISWAVLLLACAVFALCSWLFAIVSILVINTQ